MVENLKKLCKMLGGSYYTMTCKVPLEVLLSNIEVLKGIEEIVEPFTIGGHHECDTYTIEFKPPNRVVGKKWGENGGYLGEVDVEGLERELKELAEKIRGEAVSKCGSSEVNVRYYFRESSGIVRGEILLEVEGELENVREIVETIATIGVICEKIGKIMIRE